MHKHAILYVIVGALTAIIAGKVAEAFSSDPGAARLGSGATGGAGYWASVRSDSVAQRKGKVPPPPPAKVAEAQRTAQAKARADRLERIKSMRLDEDVLQDFIATYRGMDRKHLLADGYLIASAPAKGTQRIASAERTEKGNALLLKAKDILFGLLFGDETSVHFDRVGRELLTVIVPRSKVDTLGFLQASTELDAAGNWQDPQSVSNDEHADNVIMEVEYGEIRQEWIGDGIIATLRLINNLEVNEQILYARMIDVEQSTLIE